MRIVWLLNLLALRLQKLGTLAVRIASQAAREGGLWVESSPEELNRSGDEFFGGPVSLVR
jgi:hypothetical protein